jgi:cobalt-zinc-cadmium efflux system protein
MKPLSKTRTFGSRRIETLAAFINGLTLIGIPIYVFIESIHRFLNPQPIMTKQMLLVAFVGLVINSIVAYILSKGDAENNLNVRAAALHVISDLVSSVSVIIASLLIMKFHWTFIDPLVSALVSFVILKGGITITKEAWNVLMEGTPEDVNVDEIESEINSIQGIDEIHKVQLWSIASGENYMNLHVKIDSSANEQEILVQLKKIASTHHLHETIQIEK